MTTYAEHVGEALRYGALALTLPSPTGAHARVAQMLQDDAAALLAETTRSITGLTPGRPLLTTVAHVARNPVQQLLTRLGAIPARAGYDDPTTSPSSRLAGRPDHAGDATTAIEAWQGLVSHTTLAAHLLRPHTGRLDEPDRWAVLANVAALAEVLAHARVDVLADQGNDASIIRARNRADALGVEAREVARLAGRPGQPVGAAVTAPTPGLPFVTVSRTADLPAAVAHLTAMIDTRQCSVTDLFAITRVTAQTSRACADALLTGAPLAPPGRRVDLRVVAVVLDAHADLLARALVRDRADVIAPSDPTGRLVAQGREIGISALPRIQDLRRNPKTAHAATDTILDYAAHAPALTRAIRGAVRSAATTGNVAVRDRSLDTGNYWRPATSMDLAPFTDALTKAIAAGTPPPEILAAARAGAGPGAATRPGRDLTAALRRRLAEQRPARPAADALHRHPGAHPATAAVRS